MTALPPPLPVADLPPVNAFGGEPFADEPMAEQPRMTRDEEYAFQQRIGIVQPGWMIVGGRVEVLSSEPGDIVVDDPWVGPLVLPDVRPASIDRLLILSRACKENIP